MTCDKWVCTSFAMPCSTQRRTAAPSRVDGIDLTVREGETVGLVGEYGSGNSVTALSGGYPSRPGRRRRRPVWRTWDSTRLSRQYPKAVRTADEGSGIITIDAATVDRSRLPASLETTADDRTLPAAHQEAPTKPSRRPVTRPSRSDGYVDLTAAPERVMRDIRGGEMGMIFQDPMTSLNPAITVGEQVVGEPASAPLREQAKRHVVQRRP